MGATRGSLVRIEIELVALALFEMSKLSAPQERPEFRCEGYWHERRHFASREHALRGALM